VIENDTGGAPTGDSNVLNQYVYDALGKRIVITNARDYTSTYTVYNALNRAMIVRDALGHETHTHYDALGNRTVVTDADGGITYSAYDSLNRLVAIEYPEFTVQYAYDAAGNRTVMTDSMGVTWMWSLSPSLIRQWFFRTVGR
jgi:YD repeat-containing protein